MEEYGPSSVTIDEAVGKMIDFYWVPEGVCLEEFIETMVVDAGETALENHQNAPLADETKESWEELHRCTTLLDTTRRYLRDIEACIKSGDPLLEIAQTDTIKTRLTTISVAIWASRRHGIEIPVWQMYRGENNTTSNEFDPNEYQGNTLARAIAGLINELLCRDWSYWNLPPPYNQSPSSYKYFINGRPSIESFKAPYLKTFNSPEGSEESWGTVRKRLTAAVNYLKKEKLLESISSKGRPIAYKTLLALVHISKTTPDSPSYCCKLLEKPEISQLVEKFKYTQRYIRPEELVMFIEIAQHEFMTDPT